MLQLQLAKLESKEWPFEKQKENPHELYQIVSRGGGRDLLTSVTFTELHLQHSLQFIMFCLTEHFLAMQHQNYHL